MLQLTVLSLHEKRHCEPVSQRSVQLSVASHVTLQVLRPAQPASQVFAFGLQA
jgi:hypothetical protein